MNDVYKPGMKRSWFNLAYSEEAATADIYLYNDIGFFGITANDFKEQLLSVNAKDLNIYINSMGGEVGDGMAIYNILKRHQGKKTIHIDGMAASIASAIAMAGDEVIMPKTALMYLHQPWTMTAGNAEDLQRTAEQLQKTEATIIAAYTEKTGKDAAFISKLLKDETTLSASEAIEMGFADKLAIDEPVTEFAFAGAMMNRVLCQMAKKMTKEKNMADEPEVTETPAPVETPVETPVEPPVEVVDEPAPVEPEPAAVVPAVDNRADFKAFVARFGSDRAARFYAADMSFDDAQAAYTAELEAEVIELRSKTPSAVDHAPIRPVAVKISDPVAVSWKDELAKHNGDYAKARKSNPDAYNQFMSANK